jgi:DNA-binding NtrC family response regulator
VFTAKDGDEGAHLARDKKPDVAFVDLKMPGISGTQLIEILSRDSPETVTVMITAYATINSAVDAIKKGAYDYLPKPFTPEQLRILTRRAVEYKRLKEESLRLKNEKERIEKGFITFVSHEMRSPLVVIRQFMESRKMIAADRFDESILEIVDICERRL